MQSFRKFMIAKSIFWCRKFIHQNEKTKTTINEWELRSTIPLSCYLIVSWLENISWSNQAALWKSYFLTNNGSISWLILAKLWILWSRIQTIKKTIEDFLILKSNPLLYLTAIKTKTIREHSS
jgi:hypothetical protein